MIEYKIPNKKEESQKNNIDNADSLGLLLSLFHPWIDDLEVIK